jgi:hypothetical protein
MTGWSDLQRRCLKLTDVSHSGINPINARARFKQVKDCAYRNALYHIGAVGWNVKGNTEQEEDRVEIQFTTEI